MMVNNKILRVRRRDGALVNFSLEKIIRAIHRAAESIGGFGDAFFPEINGFIQADTSSRSVAKALASMVVMTLNVDERHHIPNFPPDIEKVQDTIVHVLRSYGFTEVADVYEAYRWGKHWIREGAIQSRQFAGNGYPDEKVKQVQEWNKAHDCDTFEKLNEWVRGGNIAELVQASCERYEKELAGAVEKFQKRVQWGDQIRLFIIAGPSSSGKTTTTCKIREHLVKEGHKLVMLNLDNYFWPISQHPTDWIADRDYETPHALDYHLINQHIHQLLGGETIRMPFYDFKTGQRREGQEFTLEKDGILLIDCLHGLYPALTDGIEAKQKFKIYLETLNILRDGDDPEARRVQFTDYRILRRMLRDVKHRNHQPLNTLLHWAKVRSSELANIIPLLHNTDAVINGSMPFDLPALKVGLDELFPKEEELAAYAQLLDPHIRWHRLRGYLDKVEAMTDIGPAVIPGDCVIREFIGESTIKVPHND
jgi:uridine kinase